MRFAPIVLFLAFFVLAFVEKSLPTNLSLSIAISLVILLFLWKVVAMRMTRLNSLGEMSPSELKQIAPMMRVVFVGVAFLTTLFLSYIAFCWYFTYPIALGFVMLFAAFWLVKAELFAVFVLHALDPKRRPISPKSAPENNR